MFLTVILKTFIYCVAAFPIVFGLAILKRLWVTGEEVPGYTVKEPWQTSKKLVDSNDKTGIFEFQK